MGVFIDDTIMTERCASVIIRMELLPFPGISPEEEAHSLNFLAGLAVIPMDAIIEMAAIEIRRTAV